jgi:phage protein D
MHYLWRKSLPPGVVILVVALFAMPAPRDNLSTFHHKPSQSQFHIRCLPRVIAQTDESDENEVSTDDVEKYVSVYKAMQRNRSLTVDQAAAAQGLTTKQFRELEDRVQRDDAALQQARDELQAAAQSSPAGGAGSIPMHP